MMPASSGGCDEEATDWRPWAECLVLLTGATFSQMPSLYLFPQQMKTCWRQELHRIHRCIFPPPSAAWHDLSSPTRDGTHNPCSASSESLPLDHQGSLLAASLYIQSLTWFSLLPTTLRSFAQLNQHWLKMRGRTTILLLWKISDFHYDRETNIKNTHDPLPHSTLSTHWWPFGFLLFFFWFCLVACRILVPQPGIEPRPSAMKAQNSK